MPKGQRRVRWTFLRRERADIHGRPEGKGRIAGLAEPLRICLPLPVADAGRRKTSEQGSGRKGLCPRRAETIASEPPGE